jgi:tRNA pseudouridine55 synthase
MRHGFLLVSKPRGPTSHDVVEIVRRTLPEPKVGHLGTLDPQAEGLLVCAVGAKACKAVELFTGLSKEYEAEILFGKISSTYDSEGVIEDVLAKPGQTPPELLGLKRLIADRFLGTIEQVPPEASAISIGGERAYRKLRQGRGVVPASRRVEVMNCDVLSYDYPLLSLRITCSAGTYIRSLAHDLGQVLRCGGYLHALTRTKVGEWSLTDAVVPEDAVWPHVMPLKDILNNFRSVDVDAAQAKRICCGSDVDLEIQRDTIAWHDGLPIAILIPKKDGMRGARARKVF